MTGEEALNKQVNYDDAIAIIGMHSRFPGGDSEKEFWSGLCLGDVASEQLSSAQLTRAGESPGRLSRPDYVPVAIPLAGVGEFDPEFFGFSPRQARYMDPQNRLMLQSAWHAFEDAGYAPLRTAREKVIGVFCGKNPSQYYFENLLPLVADGDMSTAELLELETVNSADFTANWIAYKLGFSGPAFNIQTACSTGLSVVAVAVQNLLTYYCDMALVSVGGIAGLCDRGYVAPENGIMSPTGVCRPLDAGADGTLDGNGVASILLKRYEDALADGDKIDALILGVGVNNDGNLKQDFMAPGVQGQSAAIRMALRQSGLGPEDIDMVELHGTGTRLGDPVEMSALLSVYDNGVQRARSCHLGSIKANIGHLNACAGLAGLIKVVMALREETIPPMANFKALNPHIRLDGDTFTINKVAVDWKRDPARPRRGAVSSFGFGGTNGHAIVEEAPQVQALAAERKSHLVFLSARSEAQVRDLAALWSQVVDAHDPAAIGFTSLAGREHFMARGTCLLTPGSRLSLDAVGSVSGDPKPCWVFSGQGESLPKSMGRQLYSEYDAFRAAVDACRRHLGDLAEMIWPVSVEAWDLENPSVLQPALFIMQYATAQLFRSVGLEPASVVGHSLGEIAAACVCGALSVEQALDLAVARGRAFAENPDPDGGMLAVFSTEDELPVLAGDLVVGARNAVDVQILSGGVEELTAYAAACQARGIRNVRLNVSHAFHSPRVQVVARTLAESLGKIEAVTPAIPFYSTLLGGPLTRSLDRDYWIEHVTAPTLFVDAIGSSQASFGLEIGPRPLVAGLLRRMGMDTANASVDEGNERSDFLTAVAALYRHGCLPDAVSLYGEAARRVRLPGYPFLKTRCWVDPVVAPEPKAVPMSPAPELSGDVEAEVLALVLECWRRHLGSDTVGAEDDFFAIGGTSLTAIQIQDALSRDLDIRLGMSVLMTARTPRNLSAHLLALLEVAGDA